MTNLRQTAQVLPFAKPGRVFSAPGGLRVKVLEVTDRGAGHVVVFSVVRHGDRYDSRQLPLCRWAMGAHEFSRILATGDVLA